MASICRCIWALEAERLGVERLDPVSEISSDDMTDKVVVTNYGLGFSSSVWLES